jgi:hypothetical protein
MGISVFGGSGPWKVFWSWLAQFGPLGEKQHIMVNLHLKVCVFLCKFTVVSPKFKS